MEYERCAYDDASLADYARLFAACFPGADKLADVAYLRWLYAENPCGPVVGFNAREDGRLAAHYVCVPARMRVNGRCANALLSLNTATHPDFQGKGLFTRLAESTYAAGAEEGVELVYGIANANSTPGFVRKLGFALVAPLESRVGIGPLGRFDWSRLEERARFGHAWSPEALAWRLRNPANRVSMHSSRGGCRGFSSATGRPGMRAWAVMPDSDDKHDGAVAAPWSARVWLGLMPSGLGTFGAYPHLPQRLRPSPLNLIVRGLREPLPVDADGVFLNFLDFDAF
jgi:GNAT superfamily N-acetyltransferase